MIRTMILRRRTVAVLEAVSKPGRIQDTRGIDKGSRSVARPAVVVLGLLLDSVISQVVLREDLVD